jgi:hypothetical protein
VQIHLTFDWIDQAQAAAFALGHLVDVLEPPELRNQLVKVARAVLARYADGATPAALDTTPDREPIEPVAVG